MGNEDNGVSRKDLGLAVITFREFMRLKDSLPAITPWVEENSAYNFGEISNPLSHKDHTEMITWALDEGATGFSVRRQYGYYRLGKDLVHAYGSKELVRLAAKGNKTLYAKFSTECPPPFHEIGFLIDGHRGSQSVFVSIPGVNLPEYGMKKDGSTLFAIGAFH